VTCYEVRIQPKESRGRRGWGVTLILSGVGGSPPPASVVRLERLFDSENEAAAYATLWISLQKPGSEIKLVRESK
jgi:hypothetical protein